MPRYKVLGITDEVTDCHCCGRTGLKRTVALAILDSDGNATDQTWYGTDCAAAAMRLSGKEVSRQAKDAQRQAARAAEAQREAARAAEGKRWFAWLSSKHPGIDPFYAMQKLGGFAKARAAYRAETGGA